MSREIEIPTAPVFGPLLAPARYKGAYGGRGSGKSHFFGEEVIDTALRFPSEAGEGLRMVCIREVQKSLKESAMRLIRAKISKFGLKESDGFKVFNDRIALPKDGVIIFQGMQDHTDESIKSLEGFHRAWCEEAHTLSAGSLQKLRPTIRWEDESRGLYSELWFSWNPRRKIDPVDMMFRGASAPSDSISVQVNWSDNPWFPKILEQERLDCFEQDPDQYPHIWEGDYVTVVKGAYFAKHLAEARKQGRITRLAYDPLFTVKMFCDIGGTGGRSDAFAMWASQFVGQQINCLNYYEAQGQEIGMHVAWLRENGYTPERTHIYLPHDGGTQDRVFAVSYESAFKSAGYTVSVVPNQGKGAAGVRIEALRRKFPAIWFDEEKCQPGLEALGWYHEKKDEERDIGLGPEHDWASHGSDAAGMMAIVHKPPTTKTADLQYDSYDESMPGVI